MGKVTWTKEDCDIILSEYALGRSYRQIMDDYFPHRSILQVRSKGRRLICRREDPRAEIRLRLPLKSILPFEKFTNEPGTIEAWRQRKAVGRVVAKLLSALSKDEVLCRKLLTRE